MQLHVLQLLAHFRRADHHSDTIASQLVFSMPLSFSFCVVSYFCSMVSAYNVRVVQCLGLYMWSGTAEPDSVFSITVRKAWHALALSRQLT